MPAPLYDALRALADARPLRLDMPGHHGGPLPGGFPWPSALDFTENGATGDLYGDEPDAIQAAEALWAERFGFDSCLFLTGGSTQGVHAGLALLAGAGGAVALDRGSHRSAYHALALLGSAPGGAPRGQNRLYHLAHLLRCVVGYPRHRGSVPCPWGTPHGGWGPRRAPALPGL